MKLAELTPTQQARIYLLSSKSKKSAESIVGAFEDDAAVSHHDVDTILGWNEMPEHLDGLIVGATAWELRNGINPSNGQPATPTATPVTVVSPPTAPATAPTTPTPPATGLLANKGTKMALIGGAVVLLLLAVVVLLKKKQ